MSFVYRYLLRNAAIRVNAVTGATKTARETSVTTSPLTASEIGSADFPPTILHDAAISSVARLVRAYAFVKDHPFRDHNTSQTANIAHKGAIPSTNSASLEIVGVHGAVRDATDGEELTEQPTQLINSIVGDANLKDEYYYYKKRGNRLYHTRTNAVIDVVTFDEATERAAIAANGTCSLPDALFDAAWYGTVAALITDESYANQASFHETYVQNVIMEIKQGKIVFAPPPAFPSE